MKTSNKKKIVVSTLALAMGAALAGSISGSVAWYQYSTRATASLSGTSAGTSRNLQIAKTLTNPSATDNLNDGNWGWDVNFAEQNLEPVSPVMTDGFPSAFKGHAVRQYPTLGATDGSEYLSFDLYFQSIDETGKRENVTIYLEEFKVNYTGDQKLDEAIRVAISDDTNNWIASKTALESTNATVTKGQLDLNNDRVNDRWIFEADDKTGLVFDANEGDDGAWKYLISKKAVASSEDPNDLVAGASASGWFTNPACTANAESIVAGTTYYKFGNQPGESETNVDDANKGDYIIYSSGDTTGSYESIAWDSLKTEFTDAYTVAEPTSSFHFDTTAEGAAAHLKVRIWLDGFAKINGSNVWANSLIGQQFSIQMRFQTVAEK